MAREDQTVRSAVLRDIKRLSPDLRRSTLAMSALALAREMDDDNSATSKSMCAKALLETMDRLRDLEPPKEIPDTLDELAAKRDKRRAAS